MTVVPLLALPTWIPAVPGVRINSVTGGAALTLGYYTNDIVNTLTQNGRTKTYTLDPAAPDRILTIADTAGPTLTNHYDNPSDSPAWTESSAGGWTRYLTGPTGGLAATITDTGAIELQLPNLDGDIVATCTPADTTSPAAYFESTEYGQPRTTNPTNPRYSWLGTHQRDTTNTLAGLTLMGVRLYEPPRRVRTSDVPPVRRSRVAG